MIGTSEKYVWDCDRQVILGKNSPSTWLLPNLALFNPKGAKFLFYDFRDPLQTPEISENNSLDLQFIPSMVHCDQSQVLAI